MFKGLQGVLMFTLCFLLLTEKVSGDSRKNSHERKITETDRERGRESDRNASLVITTCAIVCCVSLSTRTKAEERRQVLCKNSVLGHYSKYLTTSWKWKQQKSNCLAARTQVCLCVIYLSVLGRNILAGFKCVTTVMKCSSFVCLT